MRIAVTAGPTREPIDPVRFISNRSTGYMGYKIAEEAFKRHHKIVLISGPTTFHPPKVHKFISIETVDELEKALKKEFSNIDCVIMCAAVGDFKVKNISRKKIKRKARVMLELLPNKDILFELGRRKKDKILVGFSLETENALTNSRTKLREKNLDLLVVNRLTKSHNPFGNKELNVDIIDRKGRIVKKIRSQKKSSIAQVLLDKIDEVWYERRKRRLT